MSLPAAWRERVEEYVRPLYTGLDGVDTFGGVRQLETSLAELTDGLEHDARALELLVLFHGVTDRLGSLDSGGRWQIFLAGLGLQPAEIKALRVGLGRHATDPLTLEEELLHDALLLARSGVRAAVAGLLGAGRKRLPLERAVAALDAGPEPRRFRTGSGRALAEPQYVAATEWIEDLRRRLG